MLGQAQLLGFGVGTIRLERDQVQVCGWNKKGWAGKYYMVQGETCSEGVSQILETEF